MTQTKKSAIEDKYADFEGPTERERWEALKARREQDKRVRMAGPNYSGNTIGGVPRNYKHKPTYHGRCAD